MGFAILIIVLCLLQGGKSEGASGAITGGGFNVFVKTKERGAEKVVSILTLIAAIIFFVVAEIDFFIRHSFIGKQRLVHFAVKGVCIGNPRDAGEFPDGMVNPAVSRADKR